MKHIVVAGVAVIDFIFNVDEFPSTAEKYRAKDAEISGGGNAANAAVAISRLGGTAHLITRLGDDYIADLIEQDLKTEGVNTDGAKRFPQKRSSFSSIYVDRRGERQIMNFRDTEIPMNSNWLEETLPKTFDAALADTRWPDGAAALMRAARNRNAPGIIDAEAPVHEASEALELASHVAFSAQGLRDFTQLDDLQSALMEAQSLLSGKAYVTDGANGAFSINKGEIVNYPAFKVDCVDGLAAGDVWHGAFVLALAEQQSEARAIRFSNAAAAMKCQTRGGRKGAPTRKMVEDFLGDKS